MADLLVIFLAACLAIAAVAIGGYLVLLVCYYAFVLVVGGVMCLFEEWKKRKSL